MQARLNEQNGVMIMSLMGRIHLEAMDGFKIACRENLQSRAVVFDFQNLNFVGSTGILPFLDILQTFKATCARPFRFSHVGVEFRTLLAATPLRDIKIYDTSALAALSFVDPNVPSLGVVDGESGPMISLEQVFSVPDLGFDGATSVSGTCSEGEILEV